MHVIATAIGLAIPYLIHLYIRQTKIIDVSMQYDCISKRCLRPVSLLLLKDKRTGRGINNVAGTFVVLASWLRFIWFVDPYGLWKDFARSRRGCRFLRERWSCTAPITALPDATRCSRYKEDRWPYKEFVPFDRSLALDPERRGQRRRSPLDAPSHAAMLLGLAA
jgi:hypothetical protein